MYYIAISPSPQSNSSIDRPTPFQTMTSSLIITCTNVNADTKNKPILNKRTHPIQSV